MTRSTAWSRLQRTLGRCVSCGQPARKDADGEPMSLCPDYHERQLHRMRSAKEREREWMQETADTYTKLLRKAT